MNKFLAITATVLALTGCGLTEDQQRSKELSAVLDSMPIYNEDGTVKSEGSSSAASSAVVAVKHPADTVVTTLVDQDFSGVSSVKGTAWLKAISAKRLTGSSPTATLEATICRNGNDKGIDALGLYLAPLGASGWPVPELEWRHVRFLDATPLNNTRAIAGSSNFTTKGVECKTSTWDFSAVPAMAECDYSKSPAFCPNDLQKYDINGMLDIGDLLIGFLPSRNTAKVTVKLMHSGGITVTPAVK